MGNRGSDLFDRIAPVYGLFYGAQRRYYQRVVEDASARLDVGRWESAIDIGCGTGALCGVLRDRGLAVTGVDPSVRMLAVARRKVADPSVRFLPGDVRTGTGLPDDAFDLAFACYVAHGLREGDRHRLYRELARLARHRVIIHDYNRERSGLVTLLESLEGGDYFHFIREPRKEMARCVSGMQRCFSEVREIPVGPRASWYLCRPAGPAGPVGEESG